MMPNRKPGRPPGSLNKATEERLREAEDDRLFSHLWFELILVRNGLTDSRKLTYLREFAGMWFKTGRASERKENAKRVAVGEVKEDET